MLDFIIILYAYFVRRAKPHLNIACVYIYIIIRIFIMRGVIKKLIFCTPHNNMHSSNFFGRIAEHGCGWLTMRGYTFESSISSSESECNSISPLLLWLFMSFSVYGPRYIYESIHILYVLMPDTIQQSNAKQWH